MPFRNLNLKQELFDDVLNSFPNITNLEKNIKGTTTQYKIFLNSKIILLNVYFKADGTTTIMYKTGKEQDIGLEIATFLKEELLISDLKTVSFSLKSISDENFNILLEYLQEQDIKIDSESKPSGSKYTLESVYNDKFTITRYNNNNTLFQGKPLYIFSEIKIFLSDILNIEQIIDVENAIYKINIDPTDIRDELAITLNQSSSYLCETTKKMLTSALVFNKLDVELEDYTAFAFPALRAMESYIKKQLKDEGINIGDKFHQFTKISSSYVLTDEYRSQINCMHKERSIETCYNYYHVNRHTLFHTPAIGAVARVLNKDEASVIINKVFEIIERTYCERIQT